MKSSLGRRDFTKSVTDSERPTVLLKLSGHISDCLERAARAADRALQSTDPAIRCDNELLAQSCRHLARSYDFVESLERFLSDTARSKQAIASQEIKIRDIDEPAVHEVEMAFFLPACTRRSRCMVSLTGGRPHNQTARVIVPSEKSFPAPV